MARKISWHKRLTEMHRQVTESPRTPYTRDDLKRLFDLKNASILELIQLMPRFEQQNSAVVEREDLLEFLNACIDAEDLSAHLDAIRKSPPRPRRRKLRVFVPADIAAGADPETWSPHINFSRNELQILYSTAEDLVSKMFQILSIVEDQEFQRRYCDPPESTPQQKRASVEKRVLTLEERYCAKMIAARKAAAESDQRTFAARLAEASAISAELRAALPPLPPDDYLFLADATLAVLSPPPPAQPSAQTALPASSARPAAVPTPLPGREDKCA
jgi:hypothetical protein